MQSNLGQERKSAILDFSDIIIIQWIITIHYGMTSTVLSISFIWFMQWGRYYDLHFIDEKIERVKLSNLLEVTQEPGFQIPFGLFIVFLTPRMAWVGGELLSQLPGWPPGVVLMAGLLELPWCAIFGNCSFHSQHVSVWLWAKQTLVGGELKENLPHLLHLGGWALTTWLPAVQVLGHHRGVRVCSCWAGVTVMLSSQIPKLSLHPSKWKGHVLGKSLRLIPTPQWNDLCGVNWTILPALMGSK